MSFMHSIIFNSVMKNKKTYVPGTIDYDKRRKDEMEQVRFVKVPKSIRVQNGRIAAPYYGDFTGCTPVYLYVSNSEVLLDDSLMMYEKLKSEGVDVSLYRRDGMMHAWMIIPVFKEAKEDLKILKIDMGKALFG